jgi:hypothetical protein
LKEKAKTEEEQTCDVRLLGNSPSSNNIAAFKCRITKPPTAARRAPRLLSIMDDDDDDDVSSQQQETDVVPGVCYFFIFDIFFSIFWD